MVYGTRNIRNGCDLLNSEHKRTLRNTKRDFYNCAGYALNTFNWFCPAPTDVYSSYYREHEQECVDYILKFFGAAIRQINSVSELKDNEYCVAFRTSLTDFHFLKRNRRGVWYGKSGASHTIYRLSEHYVLTQLWTREWSDPYDGKIYLFAKILP